MASLQMAPLRPGWPAVVNRRPVFPSGAPAPDRPSSPATRFVMDSGEAAETCAGTGSNFTVASPHIVAAHPGVQ